MPTLDAQSRLFGTSASVIGFVVGLVILVVLAYGVTRLLLKMRREDKVVALDSWYTIEVAGDPDRSVADVLTRWGDHALLGPGHHRLTVRTLTITARTVGHVLGPLALVTDPMLTRKRTIDVTVAASGVPDRYVVRLVGAVDARVAEQLVGAFEG